MIIGASIYKSLIIIDISYVELRIEIFHSDWTRGCLHCSRIDGIVTADDASPFGAAVSVIAKAHTIYFIHFHLCRVSFIQNDTRYKCRFLK